MRAYKASYRAAAGCLLLTLTGCWPERTATQLPASPPATSRPQGPQDLTTTVSWPFLCGAEVELGSASGRWMFTVKAANGRFLIFHAPDGYDLDALNAACRDVGKGRQRVGDQPAQWEVR